MNINRRPTRVPEGLNADEFRDKDPEVIIEIITDRFNIQKEDLYKKSRVRDINEARHLITYFLTLNPRLSLSGIGMMTGRTADNKYSSVIHSREAVENWMDTNKHFKSDLILLFEALRFA
jgi:chromosomal replication initiation ATPase DnaA